MKMIHIKWKMAPLRKELECALVVFITFKIFFEREVTQ